MNCWRRVSDGVGSDAAVGGADGAAEVGEGDGLAGGVGDDDGGVVGRDGEHGAGEVEVLAR